MTLDWLLFRNPRVDPLVRALRTGQLRWIACPPMRAELAHMMAHRQLARWAPDIAAAMAQFDELATQLPTPESGRLLCCSDVDDQVFLDLALVQRAKWLFTQDKALLKLARRSERFGLSITSPQRWEGP